MPLKSCSVVLCDIKSCLLHDSFPDMSPTPLASVLNTGTSKRDIPMDCLCLSRKDKYVKEDVYQNEKKRVEIFSEDEKENNNVDDDDDDDDNDSGEVKRKEESDSDYENESSSEEDSDDSIFKVKVKGQKCSRNGKEKKKKLCEKGQKRSRKEHCEKPVMSSYEKMIEEKKAERLAFLQSLKMDDIKADISESMNSMKRKHTRKKKEEPSGPVRKSERSANVINYSEKIMMQNMMQNMMHNPVRNIPPKMSFSEALLPGELYDKYAEDFNNIRKQKSEGNKLFYDKLVLANLTSDKENITKNFNLPARSLAWHPSTDLILASGYYKGVIRIWNVESNSGPYSFKIHNNKGISHLKFNPFNPVELFSSSAEGSLRVGDMETQMFTEVYENDGVGCTYFDFVSSTTHVLALTDGTVAILDKRLNRRRLLHKHSIMALHQCHEEPIVSVDVHPMNENIFLTANKNGLFQLWDLRNLGRRPAASLKCDLENVNSALFSPVTGNMILASSYHKLSVIYSHHLELRMKSSKRIHSKQDRLLSYFHASWLPNSDELISFGCRQQYPKRICVYTKDLEYYHDVMSHNLKSTVNITAFHPFRPALAFGNTCGKICVFT